MTHQGSWPPEVGHLVQVTALNRVGRVEEIDGDGDAAVYRVGLTFSRSTGPMTDEQGFPDEWTHGTIKDLEPVQNIPQER